MPSAAGMSTPSRRRPSARCDGRAADEQSDVRSQRGMRPAPAPLLDARLRPVVDALAAELTQETAGSGRLQTVTPADLYRPDETFGRYRLSSLGVIRHKDRARAGCSLPIFGNGARSRIRS